MYQVRILLFDIVSIGFLGGTTSIEPRKYVLSEEGTAPSCLWDLWGLVVLFSIKLEVHLLLFSNRMRGFLSLLDLIHDLLGFKIMRRDFVRPLFSFSLRTYANYTGKPSRRFDSAQEVLI